MTIAQVLYVLEIADCRSISAAAERQFISQSALSQQIQRLEGELGYPLFVRTPRGLTLTAAGETFCREARPVAEQWQRLCSAVKPDGRRGRRLRIGMGARVYSNRLFQDIARYFDSHPEIDVTFVTEAGLDVLAAPSIWRSTACPPERRATLPCSSATLCRSASACSCRRTIPAQPSPGCRSATCRAAI